jgi:hypothetical protein
METLMALFIVVGFVVLGSGALWLGSRLFGWNQLAERYAATGGEPEGEIFRVASLQLGWFGTYQNCVRYVVSAEGIYVRTWKIFCFGHRPLWLPAAELHQTEAVLPEIFTTRVQVGDAEPTFRIPWRVWSAFAARAGRPA